MSEITQLREHFDMRCNSQDAKLDNLLLAIRGNGMDGPTKVTGLVARTDKHDHDINNLKQVVPALGQRMDVVEDRTKILWTAHKERRKLTWIVFSSAVASICAAFWAWATKGHL